jgi:PAS domain S-box-containing protein
MARGFLSHRTLSAGIKLLIVVSLAEVFIMFAFEWFHINAWMSPLLVGLTVFLALGTITSLAIYLLRIDPLQKEREKAQLYLDVAGVVILALDTDQKITLVNRRGCELLGYEEKDVIGKNWFDTFSPEKERLEGKREFERFMSGEVALDRPLESRILTRSGEERLLAWHATIVRNERGVVMGALASVDDITDRKRNKAALLHAVGHAEREKARSDAILAAIGDAITIQDIDFKIIYQNEADQKIIGHHIGEYWYRAYKHNERPCEGCAMAMAFKDGSVHRTERNVSTNLGSHIMELTASPMKDSAGNIIAGIEIVRDITEQRHAEQSLAQQKQDWEDTFNTITDMRTIHDRDFNIIRANKAAENVLGLPALLHTKTKCFMYVHGTAAPPAGCTSCQVLKTGTLETAEFFEPHLNRHLEIKAIPRFNSDNELIGMIHVIRDITEHKAFENQLRQSQKMEAIGLLAGGIAHDFNNLLTAILGDAYLLEMKTKDDGRLRSHIRDICGAADKAATLTRNLLAFSRKQILNPKTTDLCEIARNAQKLIVRLVGEDIECRSIFSGEVTTVMADSGQIEQVIMNLVTNARDSMPDGGVLTLRTCSKEIDRGFVNAHGYGKVGRYAVLSLSDTGQGMDAKTKERIFEPFFTTKEIGKGTGLGLSIVYGIVKQHNGFIDCTSVPGEGTIFEIYLPLVAPDALTSGHDPLCLHMEQRRCSLRRTMVRFVK